jgi:uncharacterized membrane protein YvlD (DUF360 family)
MVYMIAFFFQILAGLFGVKIAIEILPGVIFVGPIKIFFLIGLAFGIINYAIKPVLNFFLAPLRLLTFGLIGLVVNIGIVWFVAKVLFPDYLKIGNLISLLLTTIIIWLTSFFFYILGKRSWQRHRYHA